MKTIDHPANGHGESSGADVRAWRQVFACWVIASVSILGALFFSEVMKLAPCVLCWWQRVFMVPLVIMLPFGLVPFDRSIVRYALPLAITGWSVAAFHLLLMYGIVPEGLEPCRQGVSCKEVQIEWFGFVTIPLLSFLAFTLMGALLLSARSRSHR